MSKRRQASILVFGSKYGFKHPVKITTVLSGTGTVAKSGVVTLVASNVATQVYITVVATTNIGTIIGTS